MADLVWGGWGVGWDLGVKEKVEPRIGCRFLGLVSRLYTFVLGTEGGQTGWDEDRDQE